MRLCLPRSNLILPCLPACADADDTQACRRTDGPEGLHVYLEDGSGEECCQRDDSSDPLGANS